MNVALRDTELDQLTVDGWRQASMLTVIASEAKQTTARTGFPFTSSLRVLDCFGATRLAMTARCQLYTVNRIASTFHVSQ